MGSYLTQKTYITHKDYNPGHIFFSYFFFLLNWEKNVSEELA